MTGVELGRCAVAKSTRAFFVLPFQSIPRHPVHKCVHKAGM